MSQNKPKKRTSTLASGRVALLGGPNSGKSTYLGALLDALESHRVAHLRLDQMPSDTQALHRLTDPLLDGNYPQRTEFGNSTPLELELRTYVPSSDDVLEQTNRRSRVQQLHDQPFTLQVADYSGEELHALFDDRAGWSERWKERSASSAVLIFVRPKVLAHLPRLRSQLSPNEQARWQALKQAGVPAPPKLAEKIPALSPPRAILPSEADEPPALLPSDAVKVPTVLSLIELLQFVRHARGLAPGQHPPRGALRIAVLVSAWDSVPEPWRQQGPARFLAQHLPLLEDFLWSNFRSEDVFRFGLSSTGGDLNDADWKQSFLKDPQGYVEWVTLEGKVQRHSDIAMPLYWGLFGEDAWNLV